MRSVQIGRLSVSQFILGSNPFSTFSHQTSEIDQEMRRYFTTVRSKAIMFEAETLGVTTFLGRSDHFIMRLLGEYWDDGGTMQWLAQTCPELGTIEQGIQNALRGGAVGCHIHGGVMDHLVENNRLDEVPRAIDMMKAAGLAAGIAGHIPEVFQWARDHVDVDYYMCSHYCPIPRKDNPEHVRGYSNEQYLPEDRDAMMAVVKTLDKPVIHYKILAAGRNDPQAAFAFLTRHMRANDAVCVGVFPKDKPDMLAEDIALLETNLATMRVG